MEAEDREHAREDRRHEVKKGRKEESALLDELAPRADPGSREKQLEKRRETSAAMRGFRDDKSPGAAEVGDKDLLGGDNDGLDGFKAKKKEMERKKNERQLRREEILRARAEVRELRLAKVKTQEDKTMAMLRQLAQKRWGNGPLDGPDEDGDTETGPVGRSDGPFL